MRKLLTNITACCAAIALTTGTAGAQTETKDPQLKGKLARGSEVVGAKVFNQNGDHLGEINDIIFDENKGGVTHAILAIGGWLGMGEKLTAVPWKFIKQSEKDTPGYVVEVDKAKLTAAPHFDNDSWPDLNNTWYEKNGSYYGLTGKTGKKLVRYSKVNGVELYDQKGVEIGNIKDVLVHPNSGKVAYGVLSLDKWPSVGDKMTTVPWTLIRQSEKATTGFVVNVDRSKLESAPHFETNAWPDYSDPEWNTTTYGYYGVNPYWTSPYTY